MKIKTRSRSIFLASAFLILFLICVSSTALASTIQVSNSASGDTAEQYTFVTKWGSLGSGDGQLFYPMDVAVDSSGNVFVADYANDRIQKFSSDGTFITKWGSLGSGDGQFNYPEGIAVDSSGNVFVADTRNNRIQKFDNNGIFITKWGSKGSGNGQLFYPKDVAVDSSGNVFVADCTNDRIQKFDSNGAFLTKWGSGSENEQFYHPMGVAVDSSGNVYIPCNNQIQKFSSDGTFITKWGSYGNGDGQFNGVSRIAVDSSGNMFVADVENNRIQKLDNNGIFITKWGSKGSGDGQFIYPMGVAVDSSGNVYVADHYNHRIQKFAPIETPEPSAPIYNPANSHYYELINMPGITWEDAKNAAESLSYLEMKGHLATITSQGENDFIVNNIADDNCWWLGGYQPDDTPISMEPDGNWHWVTEETWDYTNWPIDRPDNAWNGQNRLALWSGKNWDDASTNDWGHISGYIIEYETPAPIYNPANSHYYESINVPEGITWEDAKNAAESLSYLGMKGHLVTITTQGESDFLSSNPSFHVAHWIGGYQEPGSAEPDQGWKWITGEKILSPNEPGFSNWHTDTGEPNNAGDENRLRFWGDNTCQWNDQNENIPRTGYIVEYEEQRLPVANFNADTTEGLVPLTVQFTDLSQDATSRSWDFGDGSPLSTEQNPVHTFSSEGVYTVSLTATNGDGLSNKYLMAITVNRVLTSPVADFSASVTSGNAPLNVQFTDLSLYSTSRIWNFGDGNTSTDQNPTHTYYEVGNYTVTLKVSNIDGISSKLSPITVSGPVLPDQQNFSTNATNVYAPVNVQIGNLSQNATEINWNIGSQNLGTNFSGNGQKVSASVTVQIDNVSQNATTINWNIYSV